MVQRIQDTTHTGPAGIGRREAIRRAALLAGAAFAPGWLALVESRAQAAQTSASAVAVGKYLSPARFSVLSVIADRILPPTDTPGAVDVGVPAFIDRLFGEFMTGAEREMLTSGLDAATSAAAGDGVPFVSIAPTRQDEILRGMANAEAGRPAGPFRLIRSAVILGYFTSEQVGRNVLHYDPVPGRYDSCIPMEQVGNRNWNT
jgi:hypothetical protein